MKIVEVKNVEGEKSGEKSSEKSEKKEKNLRKSVKRKAGDTEEPGSSKKAKVIVSKDGGRENLRKQRVPLYPLYLAYVETFIDLRSIISGNLVPLN